jgi:hypothetical protein
MDEFKEFRLSPVLKRLMILGIHRAGTKLSAVSSYLPVLRGTGLQFRIRPWNGYGRYLASIALIQI